VQLGGPILPSTYIVGVAPLPPPPELLPPEGLSPPEVGEEPPQEATRTDTSPSHEKVGCISLDYRVQPAHGGQPPVESRPFRRPITRPAATNFVVVPCTRDLGPDLRPRFEEIARYRDE